MRTRHERRCVFSIPPQTCTELVCQNSAPSRRIHEILPKTFVADVCTRSDIQIQGARGNQISTVKIDLRTGVSRFCDRAAKSNNRSPSMSQPRILNQSIRESLPSTLGSNCQFARRLTHFARRNTHREVHSPCRGQHRSPTADAV